VNPPAPVLRGAAWVAAGLVAFGITFEATARLEDLIRYGMPLAAPYGSEADLVVHDSLGVHGRPGAHYLKWALNALGTRGPEVPVRPGPGVLRVVATGASETFGQSERPGQEYPRQLEDSLQARLVWAAPGPFQAAEVLNAAFFGMSLPTATQDIRLRIAGFGPRVVVLYPTSVQYLHAVLPTAVPPVAVPVPVSGVWATFRPRTLTRLREELKRLAPVAWRERLWHSEVRRQLAAHEPGWRYASIPMDRLDAFECDLRAFVGAVRAIGAEPVLATHANRFVGAAVMDSSLLGAWERFYPRAEGAVILAFDSAGAEVTRRVGADSGVVVADVRAALVGCDNCFADYAHFTDAGAARAAGTLAAAISNLLARP
jgi:hypothetical protein